MNRYESEWWRAGFTREWWESLLLPEQEAILDALTEEQMEDWVRDWRVWARDAQLPPDKILDHIGQMRDWRTWLIVAGRGFGKTRTAVEFINDQVRAGRRARIAIVGQGEADIRQVMIEGRSGFLSTARSGEKPTWAPSVGSGQLIWPNGAIGFVYSAEDPEALRGPEFDLGWFDEPMAVPAEKRDRTVSNLRFGLRLNGPLGDEPQMIYTTTPKKHRWMKKMLMDATDRKKMIHLTRGTTYDNIANLAQSFIEGVVEDYEGTRLGLQELHAELLGDEEGALWTTETLDRYRDKDDSTDTRRLAAECEKVVVGVDPNTSNDGKTAHEAGIVVAAKQGKRRYVLDDRSTKGGPLAWAKEAVLAYDHFKAHEIVAEDNQGGEMVRITIHQAADELGIEVKVHLVNSGVGKQRRAEPVAASYERGLVQHVGMFEKLETQMTSLHDGYDPTGEDFDRVDGLVCALTRLGVKKSRMGSEVATGSYFGTFRDFANGG